MTRLTNLHEQNRDHPWSVDDAPEGYVENLLRAIVGIEFTIEKVEAKAKLSQNRSADDRSGVVEGLRRESRTRETEVADLMATQRQPTSPQ